MTGIEVAAAAASLISQLAPLVQRGLDLGDTVDPTLKRQLEGALSVAGAILLDADNEFLKQEKTTNDRLPK